MTAETALALALAFTSPSPSFPAQPAVMKYATVTKMETTTRAAQGHTHTCSQCGTTWDHAANPTHVCRQCGTTQYVQDRSPRPVTVTRAMQVKVAASDVPPPVPVQRVVAAAPVYVLPQASSACANGQCSTVSRGRFR